MLGYNSAASMKEGLRARAKRRGFQVKNVRCSLFACSCSGFHFAIAGNGLRRNGLTPVELEELLTRRRQDVSCPVTATEPGSGTSEPVSEVAKLLRTAAALLAGISADTLIRAADEHEAEGCPARAHGFACRHEDIARSVVFGPDWQRQVL
jgi:hypothetical protein